MENYEKKYEKLVDAVKVLRDNNPSDEGIQNWVNDNVPELKESEDEKIRKEIIYHIQHCDDTIDEVAEKRMIAWLENQGDNDKLIQELGEYKVKYTQEILEKHINSMSKKDDERLRKTTIAFLKDFAEQGYENAVECIDWLKSLKDRIQQNHWKPSEDQLNALEHFVRSLGESGYASPYDNNTKQIYSLLEQLKNL